MKKIITLFLFTVAALVNASTPTEKLVPVDHIYVPTGFDSNDTVEVVVTGYLPNLCH